MWSNRITTIGLARLAAGGMLVAIVAAGVWLCGPWGGGARALTRDQLELRDGVLFAAGEQQPFSGTLVEFYSTAVRKLSIDIRDGKAHGRSRGWFDNGQLEVEESFVAGISHGPRTRWFPNGQEKSKAYIENGQISGEYKEWHENGQLAVVMNIENGQPSGNVESWHASGALKSRSQMKHGQVVEQQFFPDLLAQAQTAPHLPQ